MKYLMKFILQINVMLIELAEFFIGEKGERQN